MYGIFRNIIQNIFCKLIGYAVYDVYDILYNAVTMATKTERKSVQTGRQTNIKRGCNDFLFFVYTVQKHRRDPN